MAEATAKLLPELNQSEDEIRSEIQNSGNNSRVSPLDPDFLLVLMFALGIDGLDFFTEIASFLVIPKAVGMAIDGVAMGIIGGWIFYRTGEIEKSKKRKVEEMKANIKKLQERLGKMERMGKIDPRVLERYSKMYGKQMGRVGRVGTRLTKSPMGRALTRGGGTCLGEIIPFIGLMPFWTITVFLTLREK